MRQNLFDAEAVGLLLRNKIKGLHTNKTLAGNITLATDDTLVQVLTPGAARTVTLPPEASSEGIMFIIVNAGVAAEDVTVQDTAGPTTVLVLAGQATNPKRAAMFYCDGTRWVGLTNA